MIFFSSLIKIKSSQMSNNFILNNWLRRRLNTGTKADNNNDNQMLNSQLTFQYI